MIKNSLRDDTSKQDSPISAFSNNKDEMSTISSHSRKAKSKTILISDFIIDEEVEEELKLS